ncbi:MAG TPA: sulfotransferase [Solirubrobacteraceae bacterium]|nr:sulfotransferase [Solirubrobacteraceae bacterium]
MELIGAGLPRTATTTQLLAMEILGFTPCQHMRDVLGNLEQGLPPWERAAAGDPDWDAIFGGCRAAVDFPAARFYRELIEHYPQAKVLLSVRPAEAWVHSMRETVWACYMGPSLLSHISLARANVDPLWDRFLKMMTTLMWAEGGALHGDTYDDAAFGALMEAWNEEVKRTVPADRLLVWEPQDGWEPLCDFLEVPVPAEPLPRVNDTQAFSDGIIGGSLAVINAAWAAREHSKSGLHGAAVE